MRHVAILGAGPVGAETARRLARQGHGRRIVLVDAAVGAAAGKALDLTQAGPIEGSDARIDATDDLDACATAALVVIADHAAPGHEEVNGEGGLATIVRVMRGAARPPLVFAGTSQAWLIDRVVREAGVSERQVVGSAPLAFESAIRAVIAARAGVEAHDVHLPIVGRPPEAVLLWETARVADSPALDVLDEASRRRIRSELTLLWMLGPYALAAAAARVCRCILSGSARVLSCYCVPTGPAPGFVGVWPVQLDAEGIRGVRWPSLSPHAAGAVGLALSPRP